MQQQHQICTNAIIHDACTTENCWRKHDCSIVIGVSNENAIRECKQFLQQTMGIIGDKPIYDGCFKGTHYFTMQTSSIQILADLFQSNRTIDKYSGYPNWPLQMEDCKVNENDYNALLMAIKISKPNQRLEYPYPKGICILYI